MESQQGTRGEKTKGFGFRWGVLRSPINNEVAFIINMAETLPFHHLIPQSHTRNKTETKKGRKESRDESPVCIEPFCQTST